MHLVRLSIALSNYRDISVRGKMNGAVGNYAAHHSIYPEVDWIEVSKEFIVELGLVPSLLTTQIEPNDYKAALANKMKEMSNIIIDFSNDIWLYIHDNTLSQKPKENEVGSSTMPQKINPIRIENCMGNLSVANHFGSLFSDDGQVSYYQRDLIGSPKNRYIGEQFATMYIGIESLKKGLERIHPNTTKINEVLENNYAVLSEYLQCYLKSIGTNNAYEIMKDAFRGKEITKEDYISIVEKINVSEEEKETLLLMDPAKYIGVSNELVDMTIRDCGYTKKLSSLGKD